MKKVLLFIGILLISAVLYVGGMILFGVLTKYKPAPVETVELVNPKNQKENPNVLNDSSYTFMIWNLGYGGLGKEVDFFYDEGKMVTSPKEHVAKNVAGIKDQLVQNNAVDFIMLQEVDRDSKR